ncbi:BrnT family toxin [Aurantimonas coralicida]|uniref:BrnT family toxin n=1 Tax=Aurantimonas coralicida TaxID=182270 RepID=UPI001E2F3805|nr:BrnT family toxin [Aurantimonas coralicida]MCD1644944.1 BrnT family toxin [Aurantimonas coralicida]
MRITFDPAKRERTLEELDFADADQVFAGTTFDRVDNRQDYGEERITTIGRMADRMVVIVSTQRDHARHVISMRKANDREQARYEAYLD